MRRDTNSRRFQLRCVYGLGAGVGGIEDAMCQPLNALIDDCVPVCGGSGVGVGVTAPTV